MTLVPVHLNNHWVLLAVEPDVVTVYDSNIRLNPVPLPPQIVEHFDRPFMYKEDCPQQAARSNDCGVYVCLIALRIADGLDPLAPISAAEIRNARDNMRQ